MAENFSNTQVVNFCDGVLRPHADRTCQCFTSLCDILRQVDAQGIETLLGSDDAAVITSGDGRPTVTVGMVKEMIASMRAIKTLMTENNEVMNHTFYAMAVNPR